MERISLSSVGSRFHVWVVAIENFEHNRATSCFTRPHTGSPKSSQLSFQTFTGDVCVFSAVGPQRLVNSYCTGEKAKPPVSRKQASCGSSKSLGKSWTSKFFLSGIPWKVALRKVAENVWTPTWKVTRCADDSFTLVRRWPFWRHLLRRIHSVQNCVSCWHFKCIHWRFFCTL